MTLEELEEFIESQGVAIIYKPNMRVPGSYNHRLARIALSTSLQSMPKNAISTLAHEYAHHLLGHDGPQPPTEEERADKLAAQLIISPTEYELAEQLHDGHIPAIAEELGVTSWIVKAYQNALCAI
ncbi:ImmA/IrrE family metallo-endopeptidase [Arcanobacterium phocae]|uniref:ImmA/IrrE family metallo-endopeptidase n=1 Tax=Arcanobacterium phocae TaxID=131112 RepID=UPI001C0F2ED7|nr:ImmA/IrrE family metallo-endopeptidase [Arcanobacterium phocae]